MAEDEQTKVKWKQNKLLIINITDDSVIIINNEKIEKVDEIKYYNRIELKIKWTHW